jgi:hypothetical protein
MAEAAGRAAKSLSSISGFEARSFGHDAGYPATEERLHIEAAVLGRQAHESELGIASPDHLLDGAVRCRLMADCETCSIAAAPTVDRSP